MFTAESDTPPSLTIVASKWVMVHGERTYTTRVGANETQRRDVKRDAVIPRERMGDWEVKGERRENGGWDGLVEGSTEPTESTVRSTVFLLLLLPLLEPLLEPLLAPRTSMAILSEK
jgi:hypothetical protein